MIEKIPITSREQWLSLREKDVTASVAGALLGVHEYMTPFGLFAQKTGLVPEDYADSGVKKRGRLLEPVVVELIREQQPDWELVAPGAYYRDPVIRLGATPDLLAEAAKQRIVIQIKTLAPVALKKWLDETTAEFRPPLWIAVQTIVEAHVTNADKAYIAALVVGTELELKLIPVPIHAGIIDRVREATVEFWRRVKENTPPAPDYTRDGGTIAKLWLGKENEEPIDLTADNKLPELCAEDALLAKEQTRMEKRRKEIKAEIFDKLGAATAARFAGGMISAKTISRKGFEVKSTSYRGLRITFDDKMEEEAA